MIRNVHERTIPATLQTVGAMLDTLSGSADSVWPGEHWPPMRFDRPLGVGADGGHGDVLYTVTEYVPGRKVVFRFADGSGFVGTHRLELAEAAAGGTLVRYLIDARTGGPMRLLWPTVVRWMHDAVVEDLFDKVERGATGRE